MEESSIPSSKMGSKIYPFPYMLLKRVKGYFGKAPPILVGVYQIGEKNQQESTGRGLLLARH
jgi:hypothetical protein